LERNFTNLLWAFIAVAEIVLVTVRMFLRPGPIRVSMAVSIPALIIVGAVVNAIYNRITIGRVLDDPPRPDRPRH
jgi:hypothetical protein